MRKILAGILIGVLCVGSLSGCGKGTSEETDSTISETVNATDETETDTQTESISETEAVDLNYTVPFSMADIDWSVEEGIVRGTRAFVMSYTNNTKCDVLGLDITYSKKSDVTDEQMLNAFSNLKAEHGYEDSEIIGFQLNVRNYEFAVSGRKVEQEPLYVSGGSGYVTTDEQLNLFEPDIAEINYVDGDKIYTAYYDFKNDKMNCDSSDTVDKCSWSDSDMAQKVPKPEYDIVTIESNDDSMFAYNIYGITKDDFKTYKEQCVQNGFTEDSNNDDEGYYEAKNSDGFTLSIYYESDANRMVCMLTDY